MSRKEFYAARDSVAKHLYLQVFRQGVGEGGCRFLVRSPKNVLIVFIIYPASFHILLLAKYETLGDFFRHMRIHVHVCIECILRVRVRNIWTTFDNNCSQVIFKIASPITGSWDIAIQYGVILKTLTDLAEVIENKALSTFVYWCQLTQKWTRRSIVFRHR